jgi:hypothetical protein
MSNEQVRRQLSLAMAMVTRGRLADWIEDNLPADFRASVYVREDHHVVVTMQVKREGTNTWKGTTHVFPGCADDSEISDIMRQGCNILTARK